MTKTKAVWLGTTSPDAGRDSLPSAFREKEGPPTPPAGGGALSEPRRGGGASWAGSVDAAARSRAAIQVIDGSSNSFRRRVRNRRDAVWRNLPVALGTLLPAACFVEPVRVAAEGREEPA